MNVSLTLLATSLLVLAISGYFDVAFSQSHAVAPDGVIQLRQLLEGHFASAYSPQNLSVKSFEVSGNTLYFLLGATRDTGRPPAVVRIGADGEYLGTTDLGLSRVTRSLDVDPEGNRYVVSSREDRLVRIDRSGAIISSEALGVAVADVCQQGRPVLDLCIRQELAVRERYPAWDRDIFVGSFDTGSAVIDGTNTEFRLVDSDGKVGAPITLSHEVLDRARKWADGDAARDPTSSGSPLLISDAVLRDGEIYALAGSGTPLGKAYVLRFSLNGRQEGIVECELPTLAGTRKDPNCPPRPMLPVFLEVTATSIYICDWAGNVAAYPKR